ncbi:hypothetical protein AVEN_97950-1 [Araneus ventricosus]|uniref:Uncharacterized protein n=1 Tax=Araneus ventricosus TaxID=182803 RepID=A0A4Y2X2T6_ARAVE|nr:hypothetical protein AVEN_97950-1 [Araneus ventricosus]
MLRNVKFFIRRRLILWGRNRSGCLSVNFLKEILCSAGFNLKKLRTNRAELNKLRCENGYEENTDHGQGAGFLGLNWDPIEDKIKLNLRDVRNSLESSMELPSDMC